MKKFLSFIPLVLFYLISSAQNDHVKIVSKKTHSVINGTTYHIYSDASRFEEKEQFKAVMESMDSSYVAIKRYEVSIINGSQEYFCWYLCYTPLVAGTKPVWVADDSLMMYKNDTTDVFSVYLRPQGTQGTACYRYVWQPESNPDDSSWVDICFDVLTTGVEENADPSEIKIYPNPTEDLVNVSLGNFNSADVITMEVRNILGEQVFQTRVNSPKMQFSAREVGMNKGVYFVVVKSADKIIRTERIILMK